VDSIEPLGSRVDDREQVGELQLLGEDERFDVVDVRSLVGCGGDGQVCWSRYGRGTQTFDYV
jgi:hypothetical protein